MKAMIIFLLGCLMASGEVIELKRRSQQIEGWTVRVDERLLEGGELHDEFGARALSLLRANLVRIGALVPEPQLSDLRQVAIVLDEHPKLKSAQYHPSVKWLQKNGYEPSLGKCVHISQASFFADPRLILQQPSMTLHELAHAYHDQVLGFEYRSIQKAFALAEKLGQYEEVLHIGGKKVRHYALTDHKEYFAEATEAWFGCNDFYPFVRPELKQHDVHVYEIMESVWGAKK